QIRVFLCSFSSRHNTGNFPSNHHQPSSSHIDSSFSLQKEFITPSAADYLLYPRIILYNHIFCSKEYMKYSWSLRTLLHAQLISYQGNKFSIGWFVIFPIYNIAEQLIYIFHSAPAPCYVDGMSDSPFHLAGGCIKLACDTWIKLLGNFIYYFSVLYNHL